MKRLFLASTAFIAVASVASAAEISLSGHVTFNYTSVSDSIAYGTGKDGNKMAMDQEVKVSSTATSDSGLTYSVNDNMAIQIHAKSAENSKVSAYDYSENAVSATYTIAPGLTSAITYTTYDYTNNSGTTQDGSATNLEMKVAF